MILITKTCVCVILHIIRSGFNHALLYTVVNLVRGHKEVQSSKVHGSHHGGNPLIQPKGIVIATNSSSVPTALKTSEICQRQDAVFGLELQLLMPGVLPIFQNLIYRSQGRLLPIYQNNQQ